MTIIFNPPIPDIFTDPLTDIPNRFGLFRALEEWRAEDGMSAVLLLDINGLIFVNDQYSHYVGDYVVQQVAMRITEEVGRHGFVCRMGGDEFLVVLKQGIPALPGAIAERIMECIRQPMAIPDSLIEENNLAVNVPLRLHLTASIGIKVCTDISGIMDHMVDADYAMLAARKTGRDKLMVFNESMRPPGGGQCT